MKIMKMLFMILSITFLVIVMYNPTRSAEPRGVSDATVKIGIIMDQTGPAAEMGIPYTKGVKNYFRYINDVGGINGRKIKVLIEDDRYSIPMAIAAFKKLIFRDKIFGIMFCGGTGQNTVLFNQIEDNKVPVITGSWSWTMTDPVRRYIFSPGNDNKDEVKVIMNYIVEHMKARDPRFAIIAFDAEYAKSGIRVAEAKATELPITMVGREILSVGVIDATSQILAMKRKRVTHVFSITAPGSTVAVLRSAKSLNFSPIFFGSFHAFADEVAAIAGPAAKNTYGVGAFSSWFDDVEGMGKLKTVSLKYYPNIKPPNRYYVKGWISSLIVHEGIKRAGNNLTPDTFVNSLETIKDMDMKGLTGPISYSPTDHKGNDYARMYKADIEKGYFTPVTGWMRSK